MTQIDADGGASSKEEMQPRRHGDTDARLKSVSVLAPGLPRRQQDTKGMHRGSCGGEYISPQINTDEDGWEGIGKGSWGGVGHGLEARVTGSFHDESQEVCH